MWKPHSDLDVISLISKNEEITFEHFFFVFLQESAIITIFLPENTFYGKCRTVSTRIDDTEFKIILVLILCLYYYSDVQHFLCKFSVWGWWLLEMGFFSVCLQLSYTKTYITYLRCTWNFHYVIFVIILNYYVSGELCWMICGRSCGCF